MFRFAALLIVCFVALCADSGSAQVSAPHERILVAAEGFGGLHLVLMNADGKGVTVPEFPVGIRAHASFEASGTKIALSGAGFPSPDEETPQDTELFSLTFTGDYHQLTANASNESGPSWSPDGSNLAFASDRTGNWDVYVGSADSPDSSPRDVTAGSTATDRNPRWSPDGRWLAFESNRSGDVDVWVVPVDGSAPARDLTPAAGADTLGDWSPDSSRLVVSSTRAGNTDLFVVPLDGSAATRLTTDPAVDDRPVWSPDGATIAFSSDRDGDTEVFTIGVDGKGETQLTHNATEDLVQDWQPLRDSTPPVVKALPSTGVRGKPSYLRYRVSDDSHRASVRYTISYEFPGGAAAIGGGSIGGAQAALGTLSRIPVPQHMGESLPKRFTFCIEATDPSANSATSCAGFTFVKAKKTG